ncbi:hypothetical protein [Pseudomonas sp.]|uniref:hypothetical protein n=1 Tax=Pseudomonas sp. TaxID=306 RepID=UPI003D6F21A2
MQDTQHSTITNEVPAHTEKPSIGSHWATAVALLGVLLTFSAGLLTWYANTQATKQSVAQSCIQRLDKQELMIREKADLLLSSIAAFGSNTTDPDLTDSDFRRLGGKVTESAMRFTAYASIELTGSAMYLAGVIQIGLMAKTPAQQEEAIKLASTAMKGWTESYFSLMSDFEKRRIVCLN